MKDYKNTILTIIFIGTLIVGSGIWNIAEAANASVYVFPQEANKEVGDTFDISVKVNPNGEKVCAVEGKLNLSKLTCQKITMGSGISPQTAPSCDNLNFLLGIQKCTTSKKTLFTIRVKAKAVGSGTIKFTGVDIIGEGVSLGSTSSNGTYAITTAVPSCVCGSWSVWQDGVCGGGNCSSSQRLQIRTRSCIPSSCKSKNEYQCKDDAGCISRTPAVEIDVVPPVITLIGDNPVNLYVGDIYEDAGATAANDVDEDITENIVVVNPVDVNVADTYIITYNVSESDGNPADEVTRTVIVMEKEIVSREKILSKGLLANLTMAWGEITQSIFLIIVVILCLIGLAIIGIRKWRLFQKK